MLGREVPVAEGHSQRVVTKQILHFLEARTPLDRPGREGVAQIVKVEARQLRALDGVLPGRTEAVPAPGPEDQAAALRATVWA